MQPLTTANDSLEAGAQRTAPGGATAEGATAASQAAPITRNRLMRCEKCDMLITGPFVRAQGKPMHPACLKCVKCGVLLKAIGYFVIEDQLYCETHARQVAKPPEPGMVGLAIYK